MTGTVYGHGFSMWLMLIDMYRENKSPYYWAGQLLHFYTFDEVLEFFNILNDIPTDELNEIAYTAIHTDFQSLPDFGIY